MILHGKQICCSLQWNGSSPFFCTVHSVFDNAVNLSCGSGLIPLLPSSKGSMPGAVTLREDRLPPLRRGDRVTMSSGEIFLPDGRILLAQAERVDHTPVPVSFIGDPTESLGYLQTCLTQVPSLFRPALSGETDVMYAHIRPALRDFWERPGRPAAQALLGYGMGLTPSCDDLLTGWMAAAAVWGKPTALLRQEDLTATTAVSAHYLSHALMGRFSPLLRYTSSAAAQGDIRLLPGFCSRLLRFGGTSGADSLWGILLFMEKFARVCYTKKNGANY